MKKMDSFINKYSLSKTLRFSLIPVGKTEENFDGKMLLEEDEKRAQAYERVKTYIDRYHKLYIESVMSQLILEDVSEYAELYYKRSKNQKELDSMEKMESNMRKAVSKALKGDKRYKLLFGKEMIREVLPQLLDDKSELADVEMFYNFTTYFIGFNDNRKNIYEQDIQSSIAYRCINDNLPMFLDNVLSFEKVKEALPKDELTEINDNFMSTYGVRAEDAFTTDYFSFVLSQSGIDRYNGLIGGYTCSDSTKVKGLNEYINLYNQQVAKKDKTKRLPFMKPLYKQILSKESTVSFIPEKFKTDDEVVSAINEYYTHSAEKTIDAIEGLFRGFDTYDIKGIYMSSGAAITDISKSVFGSWSAVVEEWNAEYEAAHPLKKGKDPEKYYEKEKEEYKKNKSFSLYEIQRLGSKRLSDNSIADISAYYKKAVTEIVQKIKEAYNSAQTLLENAYTDNYDKKLCKNDTAIELIKTLLDSIKELEKTLKPLLGTGKEDNKDAVFYGQFVPLYKELSECDRLYDKVRNYVTSKPYSKDKIKLNFENPQLLGGWDKNKERDYRTVLLAKDKKYYLGIMDKSNSKIFMQTPDVNGDDCYKKVEYKLLPGPNKMLPKVFFASSNLSTFTPSDEILKIRKEETFKKGDKFSLDDCHKFIDFFKESIEKHEDWSKFNFNFSSTASYKDISEFYNEVKEQGYSIKFKDIPVSYIDDLVDKGLLYLFQIYNKDFSENKRSKGTDNLHTMYFKMLFDERNLKDVVYQLNGGAEMFYRKASIKDSEKVVHKANEPIKNKNLDSMKKHSQFDYDIVKDRRFTKRQFSLHLPITLNFKAQGQEFLNYDIRKSLKDTDDNYIIGIDRGERNLLYICVIDSKGEIVEQKSLNEIVSGNGHRVDYHKLLDVREAERDNARKNWTTIENIEELKEGYISQVVHEICKLVLKYDAVIAMEDLNFGFKKGRFKVEKQVYQKFENMLIGKLNYLVDKHTDAEENGGLLKAYQLTNKVNGVNRGRQNGIIFYVPAWLTSKIDPTTGFVDLIKPKYSSVRESVAFIEQIDDIRFNQTENLFEFDVDFEKFAKASTSYKKNWKLCSNGERILTFRNPQKNNEWDNRTVVLTDEFKALFDEYNIDYENIKTSAMAIEEKDFHYRFIKLFALMLQMRNSETGKVDVDYLISPVRNSSGVFYDSRLCEDGTLPENADANGAYNIARKAQWAISVIKATDDLNLHKANLSITNASWLEFAQK